MAGLGFKDFQVGEVLTSADVDGYLMQQSVMRFADSAARGSALGTAVGTGVPLTEGMVSYLDDTNSVEVYDGSAWVSVAPAQTGVVQTVFALGTAAFNTTSATYVDITDWSATITPTSASNNVLVIAVLECHANTNRYGRWDLEFRRDTTAIWTTDLAFDDQYQGEQTKVVSILDSPATTSAITYSGRTKFAAGTNGGFGTDLRSVTLLEMTP